MWPPSVTCSGVPLGCGSPGGRVLVVDVASGDSQLSLLHAQPGSETEKGGDLIR